MDVDGRCVLLSLSLSPSPLPLSPPISPQHSVRLKPVGRIRRVSNSELQYLLSIPAFSSTDYGTGQYVHCTYPPNVPLKEGRGVMFHLHTYPLRNDGNNLRRLAIHTHDNGTDSLKGHDGAFSDGSNLPAPPPISRIVRIGRWCFCCCCASGGESSPLGVGGALPTMANYVPYVHTGNHRGVRTTTAGSPPARPCSRKASIGSEAKLPPQEPHARIISLLEFAGIHTPT